MTDQDQGNQPTPEEPANLADQVNEVFEQAKLDDDVEPATENAAGGTASEEAADPVAAIQRELDERTEDLQRLSAEFANYRRRVDRDREAERVQAKAKLAGELLVLADDLDRAEEHGDLADGTPLKAFADKFRGVLTAQGVEEFGAAGEEFNPDIHEAVQDLSEGDDKVLANVLRKGYRINDRVIRTAMVIIGDPQ
ncbi:nucleotide exchange factor GrpE [Corynebacterium amycolatum]|uniref:nucleotide exchange factor GrpE n=1 Tax=Corynebacterium amycolatum TaxID=43765 RepID=UPI00211AA0B9|nr:nucleotide exchange factor GrpE [Corynebacterium amycolatum]MCQ9127149.1 nucleotide exchange factor GrpE [Corynebacterium amycolatum]MCQ9141978.1 nucleotide exchange factor GrpE [Corynebacterium amycolatum]